MDDGAHANRQYSVERLDEFRSRLEPYAELATEHDVCVYVTGSYGRLEAWAGSDIDIFLLGASGTRERKLPWLKETKLMAGLITEAEAMRFPPFSGDGKWLRIQYVDEIAQILGSAEDDSENAFTARMLLLLESRPLVGEALYGQLVSDVVDLYFRDFADYSDRFIPGFLTNDILRFWRTLTLNYEYERMRVAADEPVAKAGAALRNYKLKFSRLSTCFSMVTNLASLAAPVTRQQVIELTRMTPRERFARVAQASAEARHLVDELDERYGAFLRTVQRPKDELLVELQTHEARSRFLQDAGQFGTTIYGLLREVAQEGRMRYLVV